MKKKMLLMAAVLVLPLFQAVCDSVIDPSDFLFVMPEDRFLYPELDYRANPAVIAGIKKPMMLAVTDLEGSFSADTLSRLDDSVGAKGGTFTQSEFNLLPSLALDFFFPADNGGTLGLGVYYDSFHGLDSSDYLRYESAAENRKIREYESSYEAGLDFKYATAPSGGIAFGFAGGYGLNLDPEVFRWVTDSTVSPALQYTEPIAEPDNINDIMHKFGASAGISMAMESGRLLAGLVYNGSYKDSTGEFIAVDSDADGYKDKLYLLKDYYALSAAAGGPTESVTGNSLVNYTIRTDVDLTGAWVWDMDKGVSMILSGCYDAVDYAYNRYEKHVLTASLPVDDSYLENIYDAGLGSFDVGLSFDFHLPKEKTVFRIGAVYSLFSERFTQNGDTAAGTRLFHSQNTWHYPELELGLNPPNESLVNEGIYPAGTMIHEAMLNASWRWTPEKLVSLFFKAGFTARCGIQTYRAFNLDTLSVWEEKAVSGRLSWLFNTTAGVSFPVGEKIKCTMDIGNAGTVGDFSMGSETHLYDTTIKRQSDDGSVDIADSSLLNLKLNLSFIYSW